MSPIFWGIVVVLLIPAAVVGVFLTIGALIYGFVSGFIKMLTGKTK